MSKKKKSEAKAGRRSFSARAIQLMPRCPGCGGHKFLRLQRRKINNGNGYPYHHPVSGRIIGNLVAVIYAQCRNPQCKKPIIIREIDPSAQWLADHPG